MILDWISSSVGPVALKATRQVSTQRGPITCVVALRTPVRDKALEKTAAIRHHRAFFLLHMKRHNFHECWEEASLFHHNVPRGIPMMSQSPELGACSTDSIQVRPISSFFEKGQHAAVVFTVELHALVATLSPAQEIPANVQGPTFPLFRHQATGSPATDYEATGSLASPVKGAVAIPVLAPDCTRHFRLSAEGSAAG